MVNPRMAVETRLARLRMDEANPAPVTHAPVPVASGETEDELRQHGVDTTDAMMEHRAPVTLRRAQWLRDLLIEHSEVTLRLKEPPQGEQ